MSGLLNILMNQLGGEQLSTLSTALGAPPEATRKGIETALPALVGGLAREATASPEGARSLARALDQDHDGSVLDNVGGLLSLFGGSQGSGGGLGTLLGMAGQMMGGGSAPVNPRAADGEGILRHVLGERRPVIEQGVSQASGLDTSTVARLLPMLAPLVMGALGKAKREQHLDEQGLASMLAHEKEDLTRQSPAAGGILGLLDQDGDGDVKDDLLKMGGSLLGQFLGGKN